MFAAGGISGTGIAKRDEFKRMIEASLKRRDRHHPHQVDTAVYKEHGGFAGNGAVFEGHRRGGAARERTHQFYER